MISGKKVRLWPLERVDLLKNYQWANDPEVCHFAGANPIPRTAAEVEGWADNVRADPGIMELTIKTLEGDYIGNIELRDIDLRCGNAEVGIIIGEHKYWGQGYGSDALNTLCRFAFEELRLHRLFLKVLASNSRALAAFRKCGFTLEGTEREAFYHQGEYCDIHILSILDREYQTRGQSAPTAPIPPPTH